MLKSFRSAAMRAYTPKLQAGLPFAAGVASASPEIAKRTRALAVRRGGVSNLPVGLTRPPCRKRYV